MSPIANRLTRLFDIHLDSDGNGNRKGNALLSVIDRFWSDSHPHGLKLVFEPVFKPFSERFLYRGFGEVDNFCLQLPGF